VACERVKPTYVQGRKWQGQLTVQDILAGSGPEGKRFRLCFVRGYSRNRGLEAEP